MFTNKEHTSQVSFERCAASIRLFLSTLMLMLVACGNVSAKDTGGHPLVATGEALVAKHGTDYADTFEPKEPFTKEVFERVQQCVVQIILVEELDGMQRIKYGSGTAINSGVDGGQWTDVLTAWHIFPRQISGSGQESGLLLGEDLARTWRGKIFMYRPGVDMEPVEWAPGDADIVFNYTHDQAIIRLPPKGLLSSIPSLRWGNMDNSQGMFVAFPAQFDQQTAPSSVSPSIAYYLRYGVPFNQFILAEIVDLGLEDPFSPSFETDGFSGDGASGGPFIDLTENDIPYVAGVGYASYEDGTAGIFFHPQIVDDLLTLFESSTVDLQ